MKPIFSRSANPRKPLNHSSKVRFSEENSSRENLTKSSISPARLISFEVLRRVEQEQAWASSALESEINKCINSGIIKPHYLDEDRRLAQEISLGVLRWRGWLDAQITKVSNRSITSIEPAVRIALRIGLYQIIFLTRVPHSAAVNESVKLATRFSSSISSASFVNAILRNILRDSIPIPKIAKIKPTSKKTWEEYEAVLSHPVWLLKYWEKQWGRPQTLEIAKVNNSVPPTYLWVNSLRGDIDETKSRLKALGMIFKEINNYPEILELLTWEARLLRPYLEKGIIYIQDAASQQIAHWLGVEPGMQVLDLCAAPGGKTAQLASIMSNQGCIYAFDIHKSRVDELTQNCSRLGATIVKADTLDATQKEVLMNKVPNELFDAVLVDAPCSGTGTLRKHPEMKWRLTSQKLAELATLQSQLLWNAAEVVKPGGVLLYATCSLEEKEGEEVVRIFRNRHPNFEIFPPLNAGNALTDEGFMRTWPNEGPDGFFAARFRRKA